MKLIDADELLKKVNVSKFKNNHKTAEGRMVHDGEHNHFIRLIADAPAVAAQPDVRANWIDEGDCHRCSGCNAILEEDFEWHYHQFCYHCGAIMDTEG